MVSFMISCFHPSPIESFVKRCSYQTLKDKFLPLHAFSLYIPVFSNLNKESEIPAFSNLNKELEIVNYST